MVFCCAPVSYTHLTSAEAENAGSEEGSGKKYVIGLAMNTQTNPFFVDVKDGVQKAADEHGIELYITCLLYTSLRL